MTTRVRDTDRGAKRLQAALDDLARGVRITVGVHADTGAQPRSDSGGTIGEVAAVLELGDVDRAPRSFVRSTVDERSQLGAELAEAGVAVLEGATVTEAFAATGRPLAATMRQRVPVGTGQTRDAVEARVRGVRVG